jgi:putative Mg2+ transporter-C (MgtC) family protein
MTGADTLTIALQILAAAGLGAVIGLERELSAQQAGLRTHMLVALGSALFTLAGAEIFGTDPTRVAAQVVTGIGFLGGGAIVRDGFTTRGLTTAASLWVTAAVGLAVGLRAWFAAVVTTVVALVVLYAIRRFEREYVRRLHTLDATLTLEPGASVARVAEAVIRALPGSRVLRISYSSDGQALVMKARAPRNESITSVGELLRNAPGVMGVDLSS